MDGVSCPNPTPIVCARHSIRILFNSLRICLATIFEIRSDLIPQRRTVLSKRATTPLMTCVPIGRCLSISASLSRSCSSRKKARNFDSPSSIFALYIVSRLLDLNTVVDGCQSVSIDGKLSDLKLNSLRLLRKPISGGTVVRRLLAQLIL